MILRLVVSGQSGESRHAQAQRNTKLILSCPYPASHQGGMGNRSSVEIMRCSAQAFGPNSSWVASDALATPVPTACGDLLFFNSKKKEAKNAALMRREAGTAQSALRVAQHALACQVGCKMSVGCETALRAVRDGFV